MRIAYVTPYQGATLVERRPIIRNRSMSNRIKIELIASLLRASSHDVEIISQGEVVDHSLRFYPSFSEPRRFDPQIPVYYGSVLPVKRLNGFWSNSSTLRIFRKRHRAKPFDILIIFNMKGPELACANYAIRNLGVPVILEYEDDAFVNVTGQKIESLAARRSRRACAELLPLVSGCTAVSPHLLSQMPRNIPNLMLRGVVGTDILNLSEQLRSNKKNVVLFSGTHTKSNGVAELILAWDKLGISGWQLHITGFGGLTDQLRALATNVEGVIFHGLVSRTDLVQLMCSARVCINPHQVSETPGNVFAFKLIEYLASGAHVITTPMGSLESDLEAGITYMPDNAPDTIAATLRKVITEHRWELTAERAAQHSYGPDNVSRLLNDLLGQVRGTASARVGNI